MLPTPPSTRYEISQIIQKLAGRDHDQSAAPHRKKSITWGGNGNVGVIVQKPHYTSAEGISL